MELPDHLTSESNPGTPDATADTPESRFAESTEAARVSWESLTPDFYLHNPFRRLGLRLLAGPREISKRVDQLKLSAELGAVAGEWAFAPPQALALDEIRAAAQILHDPPARLLHEFFWFWPRSYPHDGDDPALDSLTRGDTAEAAKHWSAAATTGCEVSRHNLAVYHHLLALDWEKNADTDEAALGEIWRQTLHHWLQVTDSPKLWSRIRARVDSLGDAQLTAESTAHLRDGLVEAIARLNATLACHHAEHGRMSRVALHGSLVFQIFQGCEERMTRVLETAAQPAARRLETRLAKAALESLSRARGGVETMAALVRESGPDLRLLEALCGAKSDFHREHARLVASTVLDGLVRYQRETGDDRGCLPLLWHLLDLAVTPELAERIAAAHTVIQANALNQTHAHASDRSSRRKEAFELIVETLVPGLDELGLMERARERYATRLAQWLKTLAADTFIDEDQIEWPSVLLTIALKLPCDAATLESLQAARRRLPQYLETRRDKTVRIEFADHTLVIGPRGIALNDQLIPKSEITALRHGWTPGDNEAPARYLIAWRSEEQEFAVDETTLLSHPENAAEDYARLVEALYYFIAPAVIERLVTALRAGETLFLGHIPLDRDGFTLMTVGRDGPPPQAIAVPFARARHGIDDTFLTIASLDEPGVVEMVDVTEVWNAVIIGYVIDQLAPA